MSPLTSPDIPVSGPLRRHFASPRCSLYVIAATENQPFLEPERLAFVAARVLPLSDDTTSDSHRERLPLVDPNFRSLTCCRDCTELKKSLLESSVDLGLEIHCLSGVDRTPTEHGVWSKGIMSIISRDTAIAVIGDNQPVSVGSGKLESSDVLPKGGYRSRQILKLDHADNPPCVADHYVRIVVFAGLER